MCGRKKDMSVCFKVEWQKMKIAKCVTAPCVKTLLSKWFQGFDDAHFRRSNWDVLKRSPDKG